MGNIITNVATGVSNVVEDLSFPSEFDNLKKFIFESQSDIQHNTPKDILSNNDIPLDLRKKFCSVSILTTDLKDAEELLLDNEILDKVGDFDLFCNSDAEEQLFDKLIKFVEDNKLQFVHYVKDETISIYVIRPRE